MPSETDPLLSGEERQDHEDPSTPAKKTLGWFKRNAVPIFMTALMAAVIALIVTYLISRSIYLSFLKSLLIHDSIHSREETPGKLKRLSDSGMRPCLFRNSIQPLPQL